MKKRICLILLFLFSTAIAAEVGFAQKIEQVSPADGNSMGTYECRFKITPKPPVTPALKYTFFWSYPETTSGNAAVYYEQAYAEWQGVVQQRKTDNASFMLEKIWDRVAEEKPLDREFLREITPSSLGNRVFDHPESNELSEKDIAKLEKDMFLRNFSIKPYDYSWPGYFENFEENIEDAREIVRESKDVFMLLKTASQCEKCVFGNSLHEKDLYTSPFTELQHFRGFARLLRVKVRLEIHEGRYDEAVESLKIGFHLARHIGEQPTILYPLVGIAIRGIFMADLHELMERPDSPNLYWAISAQPNPFFTPWLGFRAEEHALLMLIPSLKKAVQSPDSMDDAEWIFLYDRLEKMIDEMDEDTDDLGDSESSPPINKDDCITAARKWLEKSGKTTAEIEAIVPEKAVMLHFMAEYRLIWDDFFKAVYMPLGEKIVDDDTLYDKYFRAGENSPISSPMTNKLAGVFISSVYAMRKAHQRTQILYDGSRMAEAISLYMHENDGKMPESLDKITSVPLPCVDPFTGKPFVYEFSDGIGKIAVPGSALPFTIIFEKAAK